MRKDPHNSPRYAGLFLCKVGVMDYRQLVVPDPFIPCKPGWCLMYVRQAFGAPAVEATATAGWLNAKRRHEDRNFPVGCWVPVWFSLKYEPAGHVVLLAPDGSVYSTTSPYGDKATHHPNLEHLFAAYATNNPLTYLGWSEDISGVTVVEQQFSINVQATDIVEDDFMSALSAEEQREMLGLLRMLPKMLDNIAASQNEQKPDMQEVRDNVRKDVLKNVYGQDVQ